MGIIFFLVIIILFVSFTVLEILFIRRWRGWWRLGAILPGIALTFIILNIVIGTLRDPTSHNLWPLEITMWSAGGLAYLGILSLVRKFTVNY